MPVEKRLVREVRNTRVIVVHPADEDREILARQLRRIGCQVRVAWPLADASLDDCDVIFFLADPDHSASLTRLFDWQRAALIAIVSYESPLVLQSITDIGVHGVVTKPIRPIGVLAHLLTAVSKFRYEGRLNSRIAKLDETLRTRRLVERATRILADHQGISEDDAYAMIRTEAMNKQVTVFEMASAIINADKIFSRRDE